MLGRDDLPLSSVVCTLHCSQCSLVLLTQLLTDCFVRERSNDDPTQISALRFVKF